MGHQTAAGNLGWSSRWGLATCLRKLNPKARLPFLGRKPSQETGRSLTRATGATRLPRRARGAGRSWKLTRWRFRAGRVLGADMPAPGRQAQCSPAHRGSPGSGQAAGRPGAGGSRSGLRREAVMSERYPHPQRFRGRSSLLCPPPCGGRRESPHGGTSQVSMHLSFAGCMLVRVKKYGYMCAHVCLFAHM